MVRKDAVVFRTVARFLSPFSSGAYPGSMSSKVLCLIGVVSFVSCGRPELPSGAEQAVVAPIAQEPDAGLVDAGAVTVDAGAPDAGGGVIDAGLAFDAGTPLTWERDAKPLFERHCTRCHESGNLQIPSFVDRYADLLLPSRLCARQTVGACVSRAVQLQRTEGTGCRTYETPFHREGWQCLSAAEIDVIVRWVNGGLLER